MAKAIKSLVLISCISLASFCGCKSDSSKHDIDDNDKMDTLMEHTEEKLQDVNQGIIEGYDKSKDEIEQQIDMKTDSV